MMILLLVGALLLLFGHLWARRSTDTGHQAAGFGLQACGALTIGVVGLTSAESFTVKLPLILSSLILLTVSAFAVARARRAN